MSSLDEIRTRAAIDIDQLDPELADRLGPFHDMSNSLREWYCPLRKEVN